MDVISVASNLSFMKIFILDLIVHARDFILRTTIVHGDFLQDIKSVGGTKWIIDTVNVYH